MIEYKMGYKFTDNIDIISNNLDKAYRKHAQEQMRDLLAHSREVEAARMLDPTLRLAPDPYVWHDPWEFINAS